MEAVATKDPGEYAINCGKHAADETWIICVHATDASNSSARLVDDPYIAGEVLCSSCRACMLEGPPPTRYLRMSCGACVRERWSIEGAS